jgi:ABC-type sugar transport system substrate-binding protein
MGRTLLAGVALAFALGSQSAWADGETLAFSTPGLVYPFFVHMQNQFNDEAKTLGVTVQNYDGEDSTTKQTADVEAVITSGVDGLVISPSDSVAMAPAVKQAVDAGIPVVTIDRRVDGVEGLLAHVGADNVKGGEAQGQLIVELFPDGAKIVNLQGTPGASPAIDRNQGVHNVLDAMADKYVFVAEQTGNFKREDGASVTEAVLAGLDAPPDVIVAANDDMALGAVQVAQEQGLKVAIIGFDALPEALAAVRDGGLTATIEQLPGGQSRAALKAMIEFLRNGTKPEPVVLLTPIAITKDNIDQAERLGELN